MIGTHWSEITRKNAILRHSRCCGKCSGCQTGNHCLNPVLLSVMEIFHVEWMEEMREEDSGRDAG